MTELALLHPQNIAVQDLVGLLRSGAEGDGCRDRPRGSLATLAIGGFSLPFSELLSHPPFLKLAHSRCWGMHTSGSALLGPPFSRSSPSPSLPLAHKQYRAATLRRYVWLVLTGVPHPDT